MPPNHAVNGMVKNVHMLFCSCLAIGLNFQNQGRGRHVFLVFFEVWVEANLNTI